MSEIEANITITPEYAKKLTEALGALEAQTKKASHTLIPKPSITMIPGIKNHYSLEDDDAETHAEGISEELLNEEIAYVDEATGSCPWSFEYPKSLEKNPKTEWQKFWPIDYNDIDVAQSAGDFYILTGIINKAFSEDYDDLTLPTEEEVAEAGQALNLSGEIISSRVSYLKEYIEQRPEHELTKIASKAEIVYNNLRDTLKTNFKNYVHAACGGELRHHKAISGLSSVRKLAWIKWYFIYEKYGPESLLKMEELFLEFSGGAFGGKPWANAAHILYMYETGELTDELFIDRVFNLEHNGGCFLNKLTWVNKRLDRGSPFNVDFSLMKDHVLNAHAANPVDLDMLYGFASPEVQNICSEYIKALGDLNYPLYANWKGSAGSIKKIKTTIKKKPSVSSVLDWSEEESGKPAAEKTQTEISPAKQEAIDKIDKLLQEAK